MKVPKRTDLREFVFYFDALSSLTANRATRFRIRHLILIFTFLANALVLTTAQTRTSYTAEVHDHLRKAAEYLKANDPNSAVKEFHAVLAIDPKNAEAYANLGVIAFFAHDYKDASKNFHEALAIDPSLEKTQALLAISQRRLGNPSAGAQLEKSFAKLKDKPLQLQVGMELESLYQQQGEPERAVPIMQKLVDLNSDDENILYLAQRLYRELADDTLDKLAVLAPGSARMQQVIAERLVNVGDAESAVDHFKKTLKINPRVPGLHFELAQAILESSRSNPVAQDEAENELKRAIAADGDSAGIECELGAIEMLRSETDKAYKHYVRAFAMNPGSTQAQLGLGQLSMTMEKPEDARKYLKMAVKSDPLNAAAHYRLAAAYKSLQMQDAAQKEMHLFQEIKDTKDQVRKLYRQMKSQYRETDEGVPGDGSAQPPDSNKEEKTNSDDQ
jgi:tetratricopeptide (TPR) repeat protein